MRMRTAGVRIPRAELAEMPDNRRIQGPDESHNPLLFLKAAEERDKHDLVKVYHISCVTFMFFLVLAVG